MKSIFNSKKWIILLAFAGLIGLVVLASGLSGMKFDQPNLVRLEFFFNLSNGTSPTDATQSWWMRHLLIGMFIAIFLLMLGPIRPQTGKNLISQLLRLLAFTTIAMLILNRMAQNNLLLFGAEQSLTSPPGLAAQPQPFIRPALTSQWEFWITALIVMAIGGVAIVAFNRFVDRWFEPKSGLDKIANIARSTLTDLSKNKESKNAIIRCYVRMNAAVNEHRGITRDAAMTPAEFAGELEVAGLPGQAIRGLTGVFEKVRYGGQSVSPEEIKEAKNCLTSILKACQAKQ